jgi:RNA polymerase sigma factor (TIGR02999 family)
MQEEAGDITKLLKELRTGSADAEGRLASLIYAELRRLAASKMRSERGGHTLTPTALANEAWLRLNSQIAENDVEDRCHFFRLAAIAMRRILVDYARARSASKRDGGVSVPLDLNGVEVAAPEADEMTLAIDAALEQLAAVKPRAARVVELRFFIGLSHDEIATVLGLERRTVDRDWAMARAWLFGQLGPSLG